ncbi:uncharacterized protein LOC135390032 [Ornithodoros turicata]|uniref:uncharacterized protein LOC135390032 n=1 Tax=Ornithodoros turicata TaxID=34597 RepID=UPI0031396C20
MCKTRNSAEPCLDTVPKTSKTKLQPYVKLVQLDGDILHANASAFSCVNRTSGYFRFPTDGHCGTFHVCKLFVGPRGDIHLLYIAAQCPSSSCFDVGTRKCVKGTPTSTLAAFAASSTPARLEELQVIGRPQHFTCEGKAPGFYGDPRFNCRVYHICRTFAIHYVKMCPRGTVFSQRRKVCVLPAVAGPCTSELQDDVAYSQPVTSNFSCYGKFFGHYTDTNCAAYHICGLAGSSTFFCPPGTEFRHTTLACMPARGVDYCKRISGIPALTLDFVADHVAEEIRGAVLSNGTLAASKGSLTTPSTRGHDMESSYGKYKTSNLDHLSSNSITNEPLESLFEITTSSAVTDESIQLVADTESHVMDLLQIIASQKASRPEDRIPSGASMQDVIEAREALRTLFFRILAQSEN